MPLSGVSPVVDDPTVVVLDVLDNLSLVVDVARCRHDHLGFLPANMFYSPNISKLMDICMI